MNRYSRILHHIDMEDVKLKCLDEISAKKSEEERKKEEEAVIFSEYIRWKYNWRKELSEQMTTSALMYTVLSPEGDESLDTIAAAVSYSVLDNSTLRSSGSGVGTEGGFNTGQDYLDVGSSDNDSVILKDIDTREVDTITFSVIIGNNSNGGKIPSSGLGVYVQSTGTAANPTGDYAPFAMAPSWESWQEIIKGPNYNPPYSESGILASPSDVGDGKVQDFSMKIPPWHQRKNARFALNVESAGANNYGIIAIKLQRKTPMNVWVGLDSPEASSFVRVGQGSSKTTPKKRKKNVEDILAAGEKYTTTNMGPDFPGSSTKLDDPQMPDKQIADIQQTNRNTVENRVQNYWEDPNRKSDRIPSEMRKEMRAELDNLLRKSAEASQRALKLPRRKGESWQDHRKRQDAIHHGTTNAKWGSHSGRRMYHLGLLLKHPIPEANARLAKADASKDLHNSTIKPVSDKLDAFREKHGSRNGYYSNRAVEKAWQALIKELNIAITAFNEFNKKSWKEFLGTDNVTEVDTDKIPPKPDEELPPGRKWELIPAVGNIPPMWTQVDIDPDEIDKEVERLSKDEIDLKDVKNEKELPQKPLIDLLAKGLRRLTSGFSLPADLTLKYAMGDMTPVTKSPGAAYDKATLNVIRAAHIRKGDGTVDQSDYSASGGYDNIATAVSTAAVQGAKNNFGYKVTPNGIEVRDRFNFKDPSNPGNVHIGFFKQIPGAQNLATNLVKIGDKRAELAGHDPRDDNYGVPLRYTIPKSSLSKSDRDLYYGRDSVYELEPGVVSKKKRKGMGDRSEIPLHMQPGYTPGDEHHKDLPINVNPKSPDFGKPKKPSVKRKGGGGKLKPSYLDKYKTPAERRRDITASHYLQGSTLSESRKLKTAKEFFKQADIKPTFPENPPPELDPKTGMHPNYGKQAARYKKLDPVSARSMPKTGDPEIDAQVKKAAKKPK